MATIDLKLSINDNGLHIRGVRTYKDEQHAEDRVLELSPEELSRQRYTTRIVSAEAAQIIQELLDLGPDQ